MSEKAIKIPAQVLKDLAEIKSLGNVNMYSKDQILVACINLKYYTTAIWISDNFTVYLKGITKGFEPSDSCD
ncbi:MAG TPA: hypothetical protein DDZ80_25995 [Cyanobacteria bacterium UBA8803]|nr:hypothetical protein [Cyanobacteria bacterium UBA9273]HBL61743.1 hypothetical protein [Cyanobacteria bacterium UBA8803]